MTPVFQNVLRRTYPRLPALTSAAVAEADTTPPLKIRGP